MFKKIKNFFISLKENFPKIKIKQLKYLPHFLNLKEKIIVKVLIYFILLNLIFLALRVYFVHLKIIPKRGGEYIEGLVGYPQYINPLFNQANEIDSDLTKLIFSGLLKYDKNNKLVPDLASDYKIDQDQKTYTFFLKENIKFHNSKELTAEDILFTIEAIKNPELKNSLYFLFKEVEIEIVSSKEIKFKLKEPFSPFLSTLTFGILPKHLWQDLTPLQFRLTDYNLKPIGTGPFKFKSFIKDKRGLIKSYTLEKNEDYYDKKPYLKRIVLKFFPTLEEGMANLKNKNILGLSYLPKELKEKAPNKNLKHYYLYPSQYTAIFFNPKNNSFLREKNLRKALAYAIDRERIIKEALNNEGEIINSPILPSQIGFNPNLKKYDYNLNKGKELLEKIKKKEEIKIILTTVDLEENKKIAGVIKENWSNLGIKVELNFVSSEKIQKEIIKARNYEALLFSIVSTSDPDPYPFWHSSQISETGFNLALFSNRETDKVIEEARKINDEKTRALKYNHFQNILIEEMPTIFLYSPSYTYIIDKKIKGFDLKRIFSPSDRFNQIEEWYIKTKRKL